MLIRSLSVAAVAALAGACAGMSDDRSANMYQADSGGSAHAGHAMAPKTAAQYVMMAGASDMFEIQSSQVALQKAKRPEVRQFAQMMIDHHTKTSADLKAAAQKAGVSPPPPALPADKAAKVAALQSAPADGFDALYMREQVVGHQEALMIHQGYAQGGDNPTLKAAAAKTTPIVQQHLTQAQSLAR
jgi:putative membrane protein